MVKSISDPNAPKRPATAFFQWRSKVHNKIKNSMPVSHTFGELARKFSEEWGKLTDADKKPFENKYEQDRKTYDKLMTAYKHTENFRRFQRQKKEFKVESAKKGKFAKDPNAPKKPQTAYFAFLADKREQVKNDNPDMTHKDVVKKLGELWNELKADAKKPYEKTAEASRKVYEKALTVYKKTPGYKTYMEDKEQFQKDKKATVAKLEGKLTPKAKKEPKSEKKKKSSSKKRAGVSKKGSKGKSNSKAKAKAKKAKKAGKSK